MKRYFEEIDPLPHEIFRNPTTTSLRHSLYEKYSKVVICPSTFGKATVNSIPKRTDKDQ